MEICSQLLLQVSRSLFACARLHACLGIFLVRVDGEKRIMLCSADGGDSLTLWGQICVNSIPREHSFYQSIRVREKSFSVSLLPEIQIAVVLIV